MVGLIHYMSIYDKFTLSIATYTNLFLNHILSRLSIYI
jgi:hypothetical protein